MQEWLIEWFSSYPYLGVSMVFLACGLGAPVPEEIVLLFAGFACYSGYADRETMILVSIGAILLGDIVPFALGRLFGPNLLRLRLMRFFISPQRLARFDRWFRRRGDTVVFISRFIAGMRVVTYFVAGTMKMSWTRFLVLDAAGVLLVAPTLVWLGHRYGGAIEAVIQKVQEVERGILIAAVAIGVVAGVWSWLRWRRRQRRLVGSATESYVEPSSPGAGGSETGPIGPILPSRSASPDEEPAGTQAGARPDPEPRSSASGPATPEPPLDPAAEPADPAADPATVRKATSQPGQPDSND